MHEAVNPYSFQGVFDRNYQDILRWAGGSVGFSTLYLIHPERQDGPPVASELPQDCNEESRIMLMQLYAAMGIEGSDFIQESTAKDDDKPDSGAVRVITYVSPLHNVTITETYIQKGNDESFRVEAEPSSRSISTPLLSVRSN